METGLRVLPHYAAVFFPEGKSSFPKGFQTKGAAQRIYCNTTTDLIRTTRGLWITRKGPLSLIFLRFKNSCSSHAAANAHRCKAEPDAAPVHLVKKRGGHPRTAASQEMSQRNHASVYVQNFLIHERGFKRMKHKTRARTRAYPLCWQKDQRIAGDCVE